MIDYDSWNRMTSDHAMILDRVWYVKELIEKYTTIAIAIGIAIIIIGIAILWNQRKIKKMLREIMEEKEKGEDSAKETE